MCLTPTLRQTRRLCGSSFRTHAARFDDSTLLHRWVSDTVLAERARMRIEAHFAKARVVRDELLRALRLSEHDRSRCVRTRKSWSERSAVLALSLDRDATCNRM